MIIKYHHSEQQVARRSRIVWAAAQGTSNVQIARELASTWIPCGYFGIAGRDCKGSSLVTLRAVSRLLDAPCPGVMPKFTTKNAVRWRHWSVPLPHTQLGRHLPALANEY